MQLNNKTDMSLRAERSNLILYNITDRDCFVAKNAPRNDLWLVIASILIVGSFLLTAHAQEVQRPQEIATAAPDSLLRRNAASILFERNLNTFNWTGSLDLDTASFGNHIRLNELYTSNVILIERTNSSAEQRLQSNRQRLSLSLSRPINEELNAKAQWSSLIYSDNKAVGLSTASINSILAGIEYTPNPLVTLNPMVGHRWDNQIDARDRGLSYNIAARTNNVDLDGYQIVGNAQFQQDRIDPRLLEQHFARVGVQKNFLGNTRDSIEIGFSRNRREFYTVSTGALESRIENIFSFTNLLDYEFDPKFITSLFVNVYSRALDKDYRAVNNLAKSPAQFNTGIDEFRLDAFAQAVYRNDDNGTAASTRLSHSERNERHFAKSPTTGFLPDSTINPLTERQAQDQEQTKDNLTRRTSLAGTLELSFSLSDRISFSGAASILRYDTPSKTNVEDRDELLVVLSLSTYHHISRYLNVAFTVEGTLNHIVYLLRDRSANNNINRVLRFSPRTLYTPFTRFTTMNAFEVLANYTVYDFETQAAQVRSFSYRQFGWIDSTALDITNRIGLDFFVYLKLYDRGQLNWREFTERRENSFVDKTYALQARYSPEPGILFAIGARYFSQSRYSYTGEERKLDSFLRSFGPTCLIVWRLSRNSEIVVKGWYEQRRLEGGGTKSLANMTLNINITL